MSGNAQKPRTIPGDSPHRITPVYRPEQVEKQAPCQAACPNCADIRQWIGTVAQRNKIGLSREEALARAWRIIVDVNPFPSCLGRICPHPCEQDCNRSGLDEPLAINAMERFLGDYAIDQGLPLQRIDDALREEWIGVVGAGPSGLSFAYQMVRRGYRVTVYEEKNRAGGMLRYGVPDYRLPQPVLDAEIERILALGVELELGVVVGRDITLEDLRKRHAAIYLGMGAQMGRALGIPGEAGAGVWTGTDYLAAVNSGATVALGLHVIVVGGGNTAIDAARSARRTGAGVTILYRRSREEMPAISAEVDDALEEGVELVVLATPLRVERAQNGTLTGVTACRMKLADADPPGRRRPLPVEGSEFTIEADALIAAVSQSPAIEGFEALDHEGPWLHVHDGGIGTNLFAGGDVLGLGIAGNAIVQGRRAAERLHAHLRGDDQAEAQVKPQIGAERVKFESRPPEPATKTPRLPVQERLSADLPEVAATISENAFLAEVERCYSCGSCMGCEQCSMFCTPGCFIRLEEVGPGMYFTLALDHCEECGKCVEVCPCGFLDVR
jgi:NADPH-dependent glutamate synthase beta subunit-like oxidoreductase/Pyruvate/2-oxoacid:ferredoxin oxidoreductase delta subunit